VSEAKVDSLKGELSFRGVPHTSPAAHHILPSLHEENDLVAGMSVRATVTSNESRGDCKVVSGACTLTDVSLTHLLTRAAQLRLLQRLDVLCTELWQQGQVSILAYHIAVLKVRLRSSTADIVNRFCSAATEGLNSRAFLRTPPAGHHSTNSAGADELVAPGSEEGGTVTQVSRIALTRATLMFSQSVPWLPVIS